MPLTMSSGLLIQLLLVVTGSGFYPLKLIVKIGHKIPPLQFQAEAPLFGLKPPSFRASC